MYLNVIRIKKIFRYTEHFDSLQRGSGYRGSTVQATQ